MNSLETAKKIATLLDDKKGKDITILDITEATSLGDYFIIVSATSTPQINALVDEVDEKMKLDGVKLMHKEGSNASMWVLMDFGDIILHVFHEETREFYGIERLWSDAPKIEFAV